MKTPKDDEPKFKAKAATDAHREFQSKVLAMARKLADEEKATPVDLLAVMSHTLGQLLALQDARYPPQHYMRIIEENLYQGNQVAVQQAMDMPTDGSA